MKQPVWNTTAGSIGTYPALIAMSFQLSASAVLPAVSVTYAIISGGLPAGLEMNSDGLIFGIPKRIRSSTTYSFVVRATDNMQTIRDRTFNVEISGALSPKFTTPNGSISQILDSIWFEYQIGYENLIDTNPVTIRLLQGQLPPGIEINEYGMIRGYAEPPQINVNLGTVTTSVTAISSNTIVCLSTTGFSVGRPIVFSGAIFGDISASATYYLHSIIDSSTFTVSLSSGGPQTMFGNAAGFMTAILPSISVGQPTVQTYSFDLKLESPLGSDIQSYSITVANQNAPISIGGLGAPPNSRVPAILNTRPLSYNLNSDPQNFGYYLLPPNSRGETYDPTQEAYIGQSFSDNYLAFKILGYDFDGDSLAYSFAGLPVWLTGDTATGWITGTPIIADDTISEFSFSVVVNKVSNPSIFTQTFNFSVIISNNILGKVVWVTPANLGQIDNGTISIGKVQALSDVSLSYRLVSDSNPLPPNLVLLANGEISGIVSYQPTDAFLAPDESTEFSFTVEAYSPTFPLVNSTRTFTLTINQEYTQPTDTLYIKCVPSIADRQLIASLLNNDQLIPPDYLYRPKDPYFGKASSVIYAHAYGIFSSSFDEYVAAITKNHYWRNITLGEIKTAIARDEFGEIVYEVVYSEVIDNLVNPNSTSISEQIFWPRPIPLELGPWYNSETDIFTSYEAAPSGQQFYTSLTPGYARILYPNSLPNMRTRAGQNLGQEVNFRILPSWMTSQQRNGSTLGYTPAWVIAYCKPGKVSLNNSELSYAQYVQYQIQNNWTNFLGDVCTLNSINFTIDRFTVDKSVTFNYDTNLSPAVWTELPSASPVPNPIDSKNFHVLFPQKTILPNQTQYRQ